MLDDRDKSQFLKSFRNIINFQTTQVPFWCQIEKTCLKDMFEVGRPTAMNMYAA